MRYNDIVKNINSRVAPLYFITGDDSYYIAATYKLFKSLVSDMTADFNIRTFNSEDRVDDAILALNQAPIMSDYKLVIIYLDKVLTPAQMKTFYMPIREYMASPLRGNILLVFDSKNSLRDVSDIGTTIDCSREEPHMLIAPVTDMMRKMSLEPASRQVVELIINKGNCELNFISNELNKLKLYCNTNNVTVDDVLECGISNHELDVFSITNALQSGKHLDAIIGMNSLLTRSDSASKVMSQISTTFKRGLYCRLSQLSDRELAGKLGVKPGAIHNIKNTVRRYNSLQLLDIINAVDEYEYMTRSGKIAANAAFQNTVIKLLSCK